MKFIITRTSDDNYLNVEVKDFSSIESLINFVDEVGDIIIQENFWYQEDGSALKKYFPHLDVNKMVSIPYAIEIYDDYRE